jgi:ubiquinone/menaquinone biosynthesis C-methylase UbiE
MLLSFIYCLLGFMLTAVILHTIVRIIRQVHKFPIPEYLVTFIDNPLRRRIQPPAETAIRHGIQPGMTVLEVGPGSGTYTLAAARRVGDAGRMVTVDIEPKVIERVKRRIREEGIKNVDARVADVCDLPFPDGTFDAVYLIAVVGEIPDPLKAMKEFYRVLSRTGTLAFSELFPDPDYPRAGTLIRLAHAAGFRLRQRMGTFFYYTLIFEKDGGSKHVSSWNGRKIR